MYLCIYGRLGLRHAFGGVFSKDLDFNQIVVSIQCISATTLSDRQQQVLLFSEDQVDLVSGLCTWLSWQEKSQARIKEFRLTCSESRVEAIRTTLDFANRFYASSGSILTWNNIPCARQIPERPLQRHLLNFPSTLYNLGKAAGRLDLYGSALSALGGWNYYRGDEEVHFDWQRLYVDTNTDYTECLLDQGHLDEWLYLPIQVINQLVYGKQDNGVNFVLDHSKRVKLLILYSRVQEYFGKPRLSFATLLVALKIDGNHDELRQMLLRLRPQVTREWETALPAISSVIAPAAWLSMQPADTSQYDPQDDCGICMEIFDGRPIQRVRECGHNYHKACIGFWIETMHYTCPLCRGEL